MSVRTRRCKPPWSNFVSDWCRLEKEALEAWGDHNRTGSGGYVLGLVYSLRKRERKGLWLVSLNVVPRYWLVLLVNRCNERAPDGTGAMYSVTISWVFQSGKRKVVGLLSPWGLRVACSSYGLWPVPVWLWWLCSALSKPLINFLSDAYGLLHISLSV